MGSFRFKVMLRIAVSIAFVLASYTMVFSQAKRISSLPKFLILVETTNDGLKLSANKGCAWEQLSFTLGHGKTQAIDQYGMTSLNSEQPDEDKTLSKFLFLITKTKEGISLKGIEGTAWLDLSFSCAKGKCYQYINHNGMTAGN